MCYNCERALSNRIRFIERYSFYSSSNYFQRLQLFITINEHRLYILNIRRPDIIREAQQLQQCCFRQLRSCSWFNGVCACMCVYTHIHTHIHIYKYTHTHIHDARARAPTHTHTHTHTHTRIPIAINNSSMSRFRTRQSRAYRRVSDFWKLFYTRLCFLARFLDSIIIYYWGLSVQVILHFTLNMSAL